MREAVINRAQLRISSLHFTNHSSMTFSSPSDQSGLANGHPKTEPAPHNNKNPATKPQLFIRMRDSVSVRKNLIATSPTTNREQPCWPDSQRVQRNVWQNENAVLRRWSPRPTNRSNGVRAPTLTRNMNGPLPGDNGRSSSCFSNVSTIEEEEGKIGRFGIMTPTHCRRRMLHSNLPTIREDELI